MATPEILGANAPQLKQELDDMCVVVPSYEEPCPDLTAEGELPPEDETRVSLSDLSEFEGRGKEITEHLEDRARDEAGDINDIIQTLNDNATSVSEVATTRIDELLSYVAPDLPQVSYLPPVWFTPEIHELPETVLAVTDTPQAFDLVSWQNNTLNELSAPAADIDEPALVQPDQPTAPTLGASVGASPTGPAGYDPQIPVVPELALPSPDIDEAAAPELADIQFTLPEPLDIAGFVYEIDYTDLNEAIDRLGSISTTAGEIPAYEVLIPEVFTIVGSMICGAGVPETGVLGDDLPHRPVAPMLARRGLAVPSAVLTFDVWLEQRQEEYVQQSALLANAEHRDEVIVSAYAVAVQAEITIASINLGLYDAEFDSQVVVARAQLERAAAIVALHNAQALLVEAKAVEYNALVQQFTAAVADIEAQVAAVEVAGRVNATLARQFSVQEDSKRTQVQVIRAQLSAEAAKLQAFGAQISSLDAQVATARSEVLQYEADVLGYSSEVAQARLEYDKYAVSARAVLETNEATKAELRGDAAAFRAIGNKARSLSAQAAAAASQKARDAKQKEALLTDNRTHNDVQRRHIQEAAVAFEKSAVLSRVDMRRSAIHPNAIASLGQAVGRYTDTALRAAGRAAELSQSANNALARAYASAYETAGRAGAAVAAGQMSGFRATASINAVGSMSATRSQTDSESASGSVSFSETDTVSKSISA